jgi:hypothetical protein
MGLVLVFLGRTHLAADGDDGTLHRRAGRIAQRELPSSAGKLEGPADPHGRIRVEEVERALRANAKQEIEEGREDSRLARFVRAVDNMQVGEPFLLLTEVDAKRRDGPATSTVLPSFNSSFANDAKPSSYLVCSNLHLFM